MTDPFTAPGSANSSRVDYKELNGRLLLIEPHSLEIGVQTSVSTEPKDAVRADVTVLDGPVAGSAFPDALIFPRVLIGQLRSRLGQKVLGRLGQGTAKGGQSPPWILSEATDADKKVGVAYLTGQFAAPSDDDIPF
jgi:hypothetical protein